MTLFIFLATSLCLCTTVFGATFSDSALVFEFPVYPRFFTRDVLDVEFPRNKPMLETLRMKDLPDSGIVHLRKYSDLDVAKPRAHGVKTSKPYAQQAARTVAESEDSAEIYDELLTTDNSSGITPLPEPSSTSTAKPRQTTTTPKSRQLSNVEKFTAQVNPKDEDYDLLSDSMVDLNKEQNNLDRLIGKAQITPSPSQTEPVRPMIAKSQKPKRTPKLVSLTPYPAAQSFGRQHRYTQKSQPHDVGEDFEELFRKPRRASSERFRPRNARTVRQF